MDEGALSQFAYFFDFIVDVFVFLQCSLMILVWIPCFQPFFLAAEMITDGR